MTLDTIISEARKLAEQDKALAYYYLLALLERANHPNGG